MYYRSTDTGKIFTESQVAIASDVCGKETIETALKEGRLEKVEVPDFIDCIKYGTYVSAVLRYREIHPGCGIKESYEAVTKIKKDRRRLMNKNA